MVLKAIETKAHLNVGGLSFDDVPVLVAQDIYSTGVLGLDFLRGFERTTIDFSKRYLKIEGERMPPK